MGRKTGKSRKKYWKSNELAAKTEEIREQSRKNVLKKETREKKDEELFTFDKSKRWVSGEGTYSALDSASDGSRVKKDFISQRNEIEQWAHKHEKFEKRKKVTADDLKDEKADIAVQYSFKDIWSDSNCSKKTRRSKVVSKPNANEHVAVPEGGISYNPSFSDHQKLLSNVLTAEEIEHKQKMEEQAFWDKIPHVTHEQKEAAVLESIGNFYFKQKLFGVDDENSIGKGDQSECISDPVPNPPLSNRQLKLTPKQRLQQKRRADQRKLIDSVRRKEKARIAMENDALHVKSINKKISKTEKLKVLKYEARQLKRNDPKRVRKIGRLRELEELKSSFKLTEELPGNLRTLAPEAPDALFSERISSLMRRNMIEPMPLTRAKTTAKDRTKMKVRQRRNIKRVTSTRNMQPMPTYNSNVCSI